MDSKLCSCCGKTLTIFSTPTFRNGKLKDGSRACRNCFKKITELEKFIIPKNVHFWALDFETANQNIGSICQIGLVAFDEKKEIYNWSSLINPEEEYSNTFIHGIDENDTKKSPIFPELYKYVLKKLENMIVVHHTSFDKTSITYACQKYKLNELKIKMLDSSRIARHTWKDISQKGYGLKDLAERFNIKFNHHDALEDSRVAGLITLKALLNSNIKIEEWLEKSKETIKRNKIKSEKQTLSSDINKNQICFTGFSQNEIKELSEIALKNGLNVVKSVTKNLSYLCIGFNAGHSKIIKANKQNATILTLEQFEDLLETGV